MQKIVIGSDHGGYELKEGLIKYLTDKKFEVFDEGCLNKDSVDYPDYAEKVCQKIQKNSNLRGILICTTGIGMSMKANRFQGVRAALCYNSDAAEMTRRHNDANVLVLGARYVKLTEAIQILEIFLKTEFEGGRHLRRVNKIN